MPLTSQAPRLLAVWLLLTMSLALSACGEEDSSKQADPTTEASTGEGEGCAEVPAAEPRQVKLKPPKSRVKPGKKITATVETNCGSFDIELDTRGFPKTASSFVHLVEEGIYEGTPFHRVVDGFVVQGGDPAADGTGEIGYSEVEPPPADAQYTEGVVAMAKLPTDPGGTSGSQFFVVTAVDAGLPPKYAILGEVADGFDAVKRIEDLADPDLGETGGEPSMPVVIESIELD